MACQREIGRPGEDPYWRLEPTVRLTLRNAIFGRVGEPCRRGRELRRAQRGADLGRQQLGHRLQECGRLEWFRGRELSTGILARSASCAVLAWEHETIPLRASTRRRKLGSSPYEAIMKARKGGKPRAARPSRPVSKAAPASKTVEAHETAGRDGFPIVGIGASAGGLAAFEAFFSAMPADSEPGMAFVLVQHLAPDHKSILTDLVKRYTRMQVFEVQDGMAVKPNCAYIIPPNRDMAFLDGVLQLLEPAAPRGMRLPIDFFFRSLAQDQHERAICIVLSGTGSDGTLGMRAVKGEGGMAMVQTPDSASHGGMPQSAIATGLVDYVLPPDKMPE